MSLSPFRVKSSKEIYDEMVEHLIDGVVIVQDELHNNSISDPTYAEDDPSVFRFVLRCGLLDITDGELLSVERVWGKREESFYEFIPDTDYILATASNYLWR